MIKEVKPASRLEGSLSLPSDKSVSHRAAMFAALHEGRSKITNFSAAADPQSTLSCLRKLGVEIDGEGSILVVHGVGRDGLQSPKEELDCGNSGTTMRLLSGIVAGAGLEATLTGDPSLCSRPMKRILSPLKMMGVSANARNGGFAPLKINRSGPIKAIRYELPIPSAQLKSCVLLAGLFGNEPTQVIEKLASRDHTERLLELPVEHTEDFRVISSSRSHIVPSQSYQVPNDFSAAAFWLVAGSIHPEASIQLESVGLNPTRSAALHILQQMGANLSIDNKRFEGREPVADLTVRSSNLKPVNITKNLIPNCIDELPVLAVAMLFADGVSKISGAGELRHKETDRLAALAEMLQRTDADFNEYDDGLEIHGNPSFRPSTASFNSYHDHRIAMTAAVLALMGLAPSQVEDAGCAAISYPSFWDDLSGISHI